METQYTPSPRQADIIPYLREGLTSQEIATSLGIAKRTVDGHLNRLYSRLGVKNRVQALVKLGDKA